MAKKPQKTELEILEGDLAIAQRKVTSILLKIKAYKNSVEYPKMKKKYEGKYFIFQNEDGNNNRWPVYVHCETCKNFELFIVNRFESQPDKIFEFRVGEEQLGDWLFQKEITRKKYEIELAKFKKLVFGLSALTIPMSKREINKLNKLK